MPRESEEAGLSVAPEAPSSSDASIVGRIKKQRGQGSPREGSGMRRARTAEETESRLAGRELGGQPRLDFEGGKLPEAGDGDYFS